MPTDERMIAEKYAMLSPHLNERQERLWLGAEARAIGHGGIALVVRATGVSRTTVAKGINDLDRPAEQMLGAGRVRRPGAGRKPVEVSDPGMAEALEQALPLTLHDFHGDWNYTLAPDQTTEM